jgi:hypothetical protein
MKQCINGSIGEEFAKDFETFFPAAHTGEPIVDKCDVHIMKYTKLASLFIGGYIESGEYFHIPVFFKNAGM